MVAVATACDVAALPMRMLFLTIVLTFFGSPSSDFYSFAHNLPPEQATFTTSFGPALHLCVCLFDSFCFVLFLFCIVLFTCWIVLGYWFASLGILLAF